MDVAVNAALAGVLAGLGVALPLGAISVLLLHEALVHGWRTAAAAATGVALVDLGYAVVAVLAGNAVTRLLDGRERFVQVAGALVLLVVAVRGLRATWRTRHDALDVAGARDVPPGPVLRRFVGLTLINPLTAVYFVVLTASLGDRVAGAVAGTAFVAGIWVGSYAWQLTLVTLGALAGARLPRALRTATSAAGYLVVLGYALSLGAGL